jgi:hypothetical protein
MDDFSAWDFAIDFSPTEAAALIVGERPSSLRHLKWEPVIRRLQRAYEWALEYHRDDMNSPSELAGMEYDPQMLQSCAMRYQQGKYLTDNKLVGIDFWDWLQHEPSSGFESQVFTRSELTRWLSAIGMKSVYQFDRSQSQAIETPSGRWPWGDHHTELLGHLEAAAARYWVNYNPDDATTAPTNKDVAEWLVDKRNVSQKMAESIASMLRPDGLRTGPRK